MADRIMRHGRKVARIAWAIYGLRSEYLGTELSVSELYQKVWASYGATLTGLCAFEFVEVGHSAGGAVISQAAEYARERIAGLIYVGAHLLPDGDSMVTANERSVRPQADAELLVMQADGSALVNPEIARPYFYGKCSPDRVERALARLRPQSLALFTEPVRIGSGFARLPRGYVETADDAALLLQQQRDMQAAVPCRPVITLPSDHSPFFSMPDLLAAALITTSSPPIVVQPTPIRNGNGA
jgi:pimeloyl-ACP methyl ester carboxylesterase